MESIWNLLARVFPSKLRRIGVEHDDIPSSAWKCTCSSSAAMPNGDGKRARKFRAEDKIDRAAACEVICSTLKALKFDPPAVYDYPLLPDSDRYWDSLNIQGPYRAQIQRFAKGCIAFGDLVYPFLPREHRVAIGIYTTWLVWIDDVTPTEELKLFRKHCTSDRSKMSPTLQHFANYLDHFTGLYGPHAGDMIWSATFQFLNACIVEDIHGKGIEVPRSAVLFPEYQRNKCGVAEVYSFAMFSQADLPEDEWLMREMFLVPDLAEYFNLTNDLLSFYKEHVIGDEEFTFIWNYSCCHDMPLLDGLKDTASRVLSAVERMRKTSAGQPKLLAQTELLVRGYLNWHWVYENRYHVQEMKQLQDPDK